MKIGITGATGFIGSHLLKRMQDQGYDVRILSRKHTTVNVPYEVIVGDLTQEETLENFVRDLDVIFHLGALLGGWDHKWQDYENTNVKGTSLLVEKSISSGVEYFFYLSTAGVVGNVMNPPADLDTPYSPETLYERSKALSEQFIRKRISEDFPATIFRPTHIMGRGDRNTLPLVRMVKRLPVIPLIGGGRNGFSPVSCDDVANVLLLALERRERVKGNIYYIANSDIITFREFLIYITEALNKPSRFVYFPKTSARLMASFFQNMGELSHNEPAISRSKIEFLIRDHTCDIKPLIDDLSPSNFQNVHDLVDTTLNWYRTKDLI
jgi:nucleoside-diphosphate-sugar epimerase